MVNWYFYNWWLLIMICCKTRQLGTLEQKPSMIVFKSPNHIIPSLFMKILPQITKKKSMSLSFTKLFMYKQKNYCDRYKCTRSSDLLVLRRHLWIQGHKKRGTICCSNCSKKCYSDRSGSRNATSKSHDKGYWSRKRCGIKSYS